MKTLIMIGAGHSNLVAIAELLPRTSCAYKVILLSDVNLAPYSGMLPGFLAGIYSEEEILFDLKRLRDYYGFELIIEAAVEVNSAQNTVRLSSGAVLHYDCLTINTGISPTPLLSDNKGAEKIIYAKPLSQLIPKWNHFLSTKGDSKIAVVGAGSAGVEVACALSVRKKGTVTLFSMNETILPELSNSAQNKVLAQLSHLKVRVETNAQVASYLDGKVILNNGRQYTNDFVFVTTGAQPQRIKGDLACDTNGYLQTSTTLLVHNTQNVFAAGDCITFDQKPLPKAGVFAVRQGKVLAHNLLAFLDHKPLKDYIPQKEFLKILMIGENIGLATKGVFHFMGSVAWKLKEHLDRKFMKRYQKN